MSVGGGFVVGAMYLAPRLNAEFERMYGTSILKVNDLGVKFNGGTTMTRRSLHQPGSLSIHGFALCLTHTRKKVPNSLH